MNIITDFAHATKQFMINECEIMKIEGRMADASAASGIWLQVWDCMTGPTDTATGVTLKKSWPVVGGGGSGVGSEFYKEFKPGEGEMELSLGCFIGISSTEATYTASANNWGMLSVEFRRPETPDTCSLAGDLTSAVVDLQVWTELQGLTSSTVAGRRLVEVEVDPTNAGAGDKYLMLFPKNFARINTGDTPLPGGMIFTIVPGSGTKRTGLNSFKFGDGTYGIQPYLNDGGTVRQGCTLALSSTAPNFTAPTGTVAIRAKWRTSP